MLVGISYSETSNARLPVTSEQGGKEATELETESQVGLVAVEGCVWLKIRMIEGKLGRKYWWSVLVKSPWH